MITTIQINEDVKNILQKYKKCSKSTYEDVIRNLIKEHEKLKSKDSMLLREGYEEMYNLSEKINKDWEQIDDEEFKNNEY